MKQLGFFGCVKWLWFLLCMVTLVSCISLNFVHPHLKNSVARTYEMQPDEMEAHYVPYYGQIADAIYKAEGGKKARIPYGILSVPVRSQAEARRVCLNTIKRKHKSWQSNGRPGNFISYLGRSYAPINARNDPSGLNQHWVKNVVYFTE